MSFELTLPSLRPIEPLLLDKSVSEIMGNPDASWFCERDGRLRQEPTISYDASRLRTGLEVIANQLGKKLDADNPFAGRAPPGWEPPCSGESASRKPRSVADDQKVQQPPLHGR